MNSSVTAQPLAKVDTPLLAVAVPQSTPPSLPASLAELDRAAADGGLARAISAGDHKGKRDETLLVYGRGKAPPQRILLVGVGKPGEITRSVLRRAAAVAARRARALGTKTFSFAVAAEARGGVGIAELAQVAVEGAAQGGWQFTELKKAPEEPKPELEAVELIVDAADKAEAEAGRRIGDAVAAGHRLTRNLQMLPGNICTPSYLADQARALAKTHGFGVTVLDRAQIKKEGMGALLAVAQGSAEEPRFIVLEYQGGTGAPIVLVGKGVTFDSGGISIKPAQNMEEMKYDMSGAAAVLGTFEVLGRLKPKLNVVGLIPSTENLPSGTAIKPGDVIKSHLGKTIEVINTDAEGRLILCDALSYARRFKPAAALDAATLTGAVVVALGHHAIGILGNDDALVAEVRDAGERAGERCWPLPLWDEYRDLVKSDIADVKNSGGRSAGTISGAWFLKEFVEGFPWVHLDIAGTAYIEGDGAGHSKGPTAVGVRLFTEFLLRRAGS
ncbi:MAG: leucyl aminopeptidase [Gemmatimonadales bacterium]